MITNNQIMLTNLLSIITKNYSTEAIAKLIGANPNDQLAAFYQATETDIKDELWNIIACAAHRKPYQGLLLWRSLHNNMTKILTRPGYYFDVYFMLSKSRLGANVKLSLHNESNIISVGDSFLLNISNLSILPDGTVGTNQMTVHQALAQHKRKAE